MPIPDPPILPSIAAQSPPRRPGTNLPGGTFAPFKHPAFRAIWTANLASNLGATMQSVGAAWLMTDLTKSHQLVALVQASAMVPILFFGIFAGAIADNHDRRRIMLASQIGMLVAAVILSALTWAGMINPALLLSCTLALGVGTALNAPAWQASVRQQVGLADVPQAITLNSISLNLARTVGPALGGLLISIWSVGLVFGLNAASRPALIAVLWRWRPDTAPRTTTPMLPAIGKGIGFCFRSRPIRRLLLRGGAMGFGLAGYQALVPAVVRGPLHGSEIDYGLLLGLFGIGSIVAALSMGWARRRLSSEAPITIATLSYVVAQLVLANAHSLASAAPATFIAGAGWVTGLTTINVAMQMRSPEAILGRCLSIYQAVTFGSMAIGAWVWGAVADWQGLALALHAAAIFLVISLGALRLIAPMPSGASHRIA